MNDLGRTSLPPATITRLRARLARGMAVWRGVKAEGRPSDPGDFGRGTYHSTSFIRADQYGVPFRMNLRLSNPLVLTVEEAYTQIADRFGTISGIANAPGGGAGDFTLRAVCAAEAAATLLALGYDGVAVVNEKKRGGHAEIELVRLCAGPVAVAAGPQALAAA